MNSASGSNLCYVRSCVCMKRKGLLLGHTEFWGLGYSLRRYSHIYIYMYILSVLQKRKASNCTTLGISDGLPLRSHRVSAPVYTPAESKMKMSSRATKDPVLTEPGRWVVDIWERFMSDTIGFYAVSPPWTPQLDEIIFFPPPAPVSSLCLTIKGLLTREVPKQLFCPTTESNNSMVHRPVSAGPPYSHVY